MDAAITADDEADRQSQNPAVTLRREARFFTVFLLDRTRAQATAPLLPLGYGIALPHPVLAEIAGDVEYLYVLEAPGVELLVGGFYVRALASVSKEMMSRVTRVGDR